MNGKVIGDALMGEDVARNGRGPVDVLSQYTDRWIKENHGKPEPLKPVFRSDFEPSISRIQT